MDLNKHQRWCDLMSKMNDETIRRNMARDYPGYMDHEPYITPEEEQELDVISGELILQRLYDCFFAGSSKTK